MDIGPTDAATRADPAAGSIVTTVETRDVARLGRDDSGSRPLLTARQEELLAHCVAQGYYDIPRRTNLRSLGKELGITATSLSLALRRAEARILPLYANARGPDSPRAAVKVRRRPSRGRPRPYAVPR